MAEQMVRFFHWLPHINISFHLVEARFEPESDLYLESLGFAASVPAAWLLLTLLVLLTYLLTRCCDSQLKRGRSLACHRWFLAITAFLCRSAFGVFTLTRPSGRCFVQLPVTWIVECLAHP